MKRIIFILLTAFLAISIAACDPPAPTPAAPTPAALSPQPSSPSAALEIVTFADPVLEAMVRGSMGKPTGDITAAEAESVTRLSLGNEWQRYISEEAVIHTIGGLEYFKNLESLDLSFHAIADITPLSGLKKLTALSLGGNPVSDIAPLAGLTSLKVLSLSGCAAQDYSPLSGLVNLNYLRLDNSALTDVSPLLPLTSLRHLYLAGCPISDTFPLLDIYQSLEQKDFTIALTLAELGFNMDSGDKQAIYDGERASVRINHVEWGDPPGEWMRNCVRTVFVQNDYKVDIGYYPYFDAYVVLASGEPAINYVYDHKNESFMFGEGDRASSEQTVRAIFTGTDAEDILLVPVQTFHDLLTESLGISANRLFEMPFEPLTLRNLGFFPDETNTAYAYHEHEPHDMHISIYRPEWGKPPENSNPDGSNIEFYDHDVNGYSLLILYFADVGKYHIALFKDGVDCAFGIYPATDEYGWEYPDLDTVQQMFSAAFETQGKELYDKPLAHFEQVVQDRFGLTTAELYALPVGE
jgi:hypothetical protein